MKTALLTLAALALTASVANAKCSTASLNGNWMLGSDDTGNPLPIVFLNGVARNQGVKIYQVTLGSNCKGSITISATGYIGRIATERLSSTSTLRPNTLQIGIPAQTVGPNSTNGVLLTLFRL